MAMITADRYAGVAELADALDSGSNGRKAVQVQVLSPAPETLEWVNHSGVFLFLFSFGSEENP